MKRLLACAALAVCVLPGQTRFNALTGKQDFIGGKAWASDPTGSACSPGMIAIYAGALYVCDSGVLASAAAPTSAGVSEFGPTGNKRTGSVDPAVGDYSQSLITGLKASDNVAHASITLTALADGPAITGRCYANDQTNPVFMIQRTSNGSLMRFYCDGSVRTISVAAVPNAPTGEWGWGYVPDKGLCWKYESGPQTCVADLISGGAVWGSISGTLTDQPDLDAALDLKAPLLGATLTNPTLVGATANSINDTAIPTSKTLVTTDDARLTDARTPTAHASSHQPGGGDEIAEEIAAAGGIPKAASNGKLDSSWISQASVAQFESLLEVQGSNVNGPVDPSVLPNPTASTKGGVIAKTCTGTQKVSALATDGTLTCSEDQDSGGSTTANPNTKITIAADESTGAVTYASALADADTVNVGDCTDTDGVPWIKTGLTKLTTGVTVSIAPVVAPAGGLTCPVNTSGGGSGSGTGDVTAAAAFANDNRLIRSDGVDKGLQASGVVLDDSDNMTVPGNVTVNGTLSVGDGTVAGEAVLNELTANGTNYQSWLANDIITNTLRLQFPNADPASSVMLFPAPTGVISQFSWAKLPANTTATSNQFFTAYNSTTGAFTKAPLDDAAIPSAIARDTEVTTAVGTSRTRACELHIWGTGASSVLQDTDDEAASCFNVFGVTETITAVNCRADAGSPTVTPVVTGGGAILTGALTCGTASFAAGTLSGTPTVASAGSIDANITTAGGTATNIRLVFTLTR
jgi:hypothetical protein